MHCTNINHPQIQDWAKEFDKSPEYIGAIVSLWQESNNRLDEFPSKLWMENQIKSSNKENEIAIPGQLIKEKPQGVPIKQGVSELFESNPELANAVYEVLGFRSDEQKNNDKDAFELEVIERNIDDHNFNGFIINLKIDGKIVGSIQINTGNNGFNVNGELFAEVRNVSTDPSIRGKGYGKMLYALAFEELNKRGFAGFGNFGELVLDKNVFKIRESLITEKIIYDGEESTIYRGFKENKNPLKKQKITPQQKQQATFMFSEFLDVYLQDFEQVEKILKEEKIIDKKCS